MKAWKYFQERESSIWGEIEKEFEKVKDLSLEELLSYCIIWMEEQRFHDLSMLKSQELSSNYNFFISLLLSKTEEGNIIKDKKEFATIFNNIVGKTHNKNKENRLKNLLESISKWNKFYQYIILYYCFDETTDIIEEHDTLYLYQTPKDYYNWREGDLRYSTIKQSYLEKIIDNLEHNYPKVFKIK